MEDIITRFSTFMDVYKDKTITSGHIEDILSAFKSSIETARRIGYNQANDEPNDLSIFGKYYKECVLGGEVGWIAWEDSKPVYYKMKKDDASIPPLIPYKPPFIKWGSQK